MTSDKSYAGWYFLAIMVVIYLIVALFSMEKAASALEIFISIIIELLPLLLLIFVLMALTNYFITPKLLVKYMGEDSGVKGWFIAVIAGILSSGPIYMWYPLLGELQKHGVRNGLLAAFLYNRAIKIPFLPMIILYFGLVYSIVLLLFMVLVSIFQGMIVESIMER